MTAKTKTIKISEKYHKILKLMASVQGNNISDQLEKCIDHEIARDENLQELLKFLE